MTNVVNPHNTAQPIAASLSSASVQTNSLVNVPSTTNQTLLSLISSGQLSLNAIEGATATVAPHGLGSPAVVASPSTAPVSGAAPPQAPTVTANVALSGGYGGS
jgi:hypothetical protein